MRLTIIQYGDYREAAMNFEKGGKDKYYAQQYSVDVVAEIAKKAEDVCVVCVNSLWYEQTMSNGVRTIGVPLYSAFTIKELIKLVSDQRPTHLIVRSPIVPLLKWGLRNEVKTLPIFATSFPDVGLIKGWYRYHSLVRVLNKPAIEWIGNHNKNSCQDLRKKGVDPQKIVPWDWPPLRRPQDFTMKELENNVTPILLFYAGVISEEKGIGDCIEAVKLLKDSGIAVKLRAAGRGDVERYTAYAQALGVEGQVEFLGLIPHNDVVEAMHQHHAVIVPSRHTYPEGLPMTIYDAFCSRSPLIASDHPMFLGKVVPDKTALVFQASNPMSLMSCIKRLMNDPVLYRSLSENSVAAWEGLQLPTKWGELIKRALRNSPQDHEWKNKYCLAANSSDLH